MSATVAEATKKQSKITENINNNIAAISARSGETAEVATRTLGISQNLNSHAQKLNELLAGFTLMKS